MESPRYPVSNLLSHPRPQPPRGETAAPHLFLFIHPEPRMFSVSLYRTYALGSKTGVKKGLYNMISSKADCAIPVPSRRGENGQHCLFCGILEYPHGSPLASEVLTQLSKNTCEPIWPQTFFPRPPKTPKYPNKTRRVISKFLVEILTELLTPRRATSHVPSLEAPFPSRPQLCFQTQGIRDQPLKVTDPLFLRPKVSKCTTHWSRLRRLGHRTAPQH